MTAIALLRPDVSSKSIERFKAYAEIRIQENLEETPDCSAVLLFGGDGTVHRYLPKLHKLKIPVLVVPCGSGNDFAKALGLRDQEIALEAWKQFCFGRRNVRKVDLGAIHACDQKGEPEAERETLFCCVAGAGMDAEANARANRLPPWLKGHGGYLLAALRSLIAFRAVEMTVIAEDRELRRPALFIAVGNEIGRA